MNFGEKTSVVRDAISRIELLAEMQDDLDAIERWNEMELWGNKTYGELMNELSGLTAYKFEVVEGNVQLKVDGLMGSLKRSSSEKKSGKAGKRVRESKRK